jgi:hypothetical protein
MTTNYACILLSYTNLRGIAKLKEHWDRTGGDLGHIDRARSAQNQLLFGASDPVSEIQKRVAEAGAKIHGNCKHPYLNGLCVASPNFFTETDNSTSGLEPSARLAAWAAASLEYLRERYGENLVRVFLEVDEETPHISFVVCPIDTKTSAKGSRAWISPSSVKLGHRNDYQTEQTLYADAVAHLGLIRGEVKEITGATHQSMKEFSLAKSAEAEAKLEEAEAKIALAETRLHDLQSAQTAIDARECLLTARENEMRQQTEALMAQKEVVEHARTQLDRRLSQQKKDVARLEARAAGLNLIGHGMILGTAKYVPHFEKDLNALPRLGPRPTAKLIETGDWLRCQEDIEAAWDEVADYSEAIETMLERDVAMRTHDEMRRLAEMQRNLAEIASQITVQLARWFDANPSAATADIITTLRSADLSGIDDLLDVLERAQTSAESELLMPAPAF